MAFKKSDQPSHSKQATSFTVVLILFVTGCGLNPPSGTGPAPNGNKTVRLPSPTRETGSNADQVQACDISILFVGNSHTAAQDLPNLVCKMLQYRDPQRTVYSYVVSTRFLEDAAHDPRCIEEIESRPWKFVVLQAQKISMSGRYEYSREEGIDLAKRAKAKGATVLFFSEWGRKGVEGEGLRTEKVYQSMADASGSSVVPIGAAWDLALAERPDLPLHDPDGNHQSPVGAFLTACVLYGRLTDENPDDLALFPYLNVSVSDREFLARAAATAISNKSGFHADQADSPDSRGSDRQ